MCVSCAAGALSPRYESASSSVCTASSTLKSSISAQPSCAHVGDWCVSDTAARYALIVGFTRRSALCSVARLMYAWSVGGAAGDERSAWR